MKRLHKSRNDRVLAGVCGGIAEFFGIDPTLGAGLGCDDLFRRQRAAAVYHLCSDHSR